MIKLETNMYVRTKEGYICKILKLNEDYESVDYLDHNDIRSSSIRKKNVIKARHNVKELLKAGDIIRFEIKTPLETSGKLKGITDITDEEMLKEIKNNENYHILSILTTEMFSSMEYKI